MKKKFSLSPYLYKLNLYIIYKKYFFKYFYNFILNLLQIIFYFTVNYLQKLSFTYFYKIYVNNQMKNLYYKFNILKSKILYFFKNKFNV